MQPILALLHPIAPLFAKRTLRQMSQVVYAMLVISGRITMLGLSRWTEKGGSYRTLQRFYHTLLPWSELHWLFFQKLFLKADGEYLIGGDEVVVSKAGTQTHGLDRFFAGLQQRVIPGLSFFVLSLIHTTEARSYPLQITQTVKTAAEKATSKAKAEAKKAKKTGGKRKPGRPKGSKNKDKQAVELNPELIRIQNGLRNLLDRVGNLLRLTYVVLDGHFGNYPSAFMVRQLNLHLISKMRYDAVLHAPFTGEKKKFGPTPKYGNRIDVYQLDAKYLKATAVEGHIRTDIYQGQFHNPEFAFALNVVILLKTNLTTQAQAHVILFSTDLTLDHDKIIHYYSLRFQIEFNFRDAKQYWGLEDFMNVKETAVTNASNLSFFMVNFSQALLKPMRENQPDYSVLDLKAHYRGYRYARETIKLLPEKPDAILLITIFEHIAKLGAIHPASPPSAST